MFFLNKHLLGPRCWAKKGTGASFGHSAQKNSRPEGFVFFFCCFVWFLFLDVPFWSRAGFLSGVLEVGLFSSMVNIDLYKWMQYVNDRHLFSCNGSASDM